MMPRVSLGFKVLKTLLCVSLVAISTHGASGLSLDKRSGESGDKGQVLDVLDKLAHNASDDAAKKELDQLVGGKKLEEMERSTSAGSEDGSSEHGSLATQHNSEIRCTPGPIENAVKLLDIVKALKKEEKNPEIVELLQEFATALKDKKLTTEECADIMSSGTSSSGSADNSRTSLLQVSAKSLARRKGMGALRAFGRGAAGGAVGGGASGGLLGLAIGGPIGAKIGGAIGGAAGFIGGGLANVITLRGICQAARAQCGAFGLRSGRGCLLDCSYWGGCQLRFQQRAGGGLCFEDKLVVEATMNPGTPWNTLYGFASPCNRCASNNNSPANAVIYGNLYRGWGGRGAVPTANVLGIPHALGNLGSVPTLINGCDNPGVGPQCGGRLQYMCFQNDWIAGANPPAPPINAWHSHYRNLGISYYRTG